MEPRREGTSCHKELRSGRVVAVGVNSIGEEINVRKVIPPGFIMILWERRRPLAPLGKSRKGRNAFRSLPEERVPCLPPDFTWLLVLMKSDLIFPTKQDKELFHWKQVFTFSFSESNLLTTTHWQQQQEVPFPSCCCHLEKFSRHQHILLCLSFWCYNPPSVYRILRLQAFITTANLFSPTANMQTQRQSERRVLFSALRNVSSKRVSEEG